MSQENREHMQEFLNDYLAGANIAASVSSTRWATPPIAIPMSDFARIGDHMIWGAALSALRAEKPVDHSYLTFSLGYGTIVERVDVLVPPPHTFNDDNILGIANAIGRLRSKFVNALGHRINQELHFFQRLTDAQITEEIATRQDKVLPIVGSTYLTLTTSECATPLTKIDLHQFVTSSRSTILGAITHYLRILVLQREKLCKITLAHELNAESISIRLLPDLEALAKSDGFNVAVGTLNRTFLSSISKRYSAEAAYWSYESARLAAQVSVVPSDQPVH